jgi:beta-lactamase regulating signal transducer with metallopeptidase domain
MNTAHWHLLFNHFPIIGNIIGLFLLALGFLLKNEIVRRCAYAVFILTGLLCIPAYLTGEPAEEVAENLAGVSHQIIHKHEDAAAFGFLASGITAISALIALFASLRNKTWKGMLGILTLLAAVGTAIIMYNVGNSGGEIRHTEIRKDNAVQAGEQKEGGADDDD